MATNAANFLGEQGHNVTLFTVANETRAGLKEEHGLKRIIHPDMVLYDNNMHDEFEVTLQKSI